MKARTQGQSFGWYWVSSETIFRVAAEFKAQRYVLKSMNFYSHEEKLYGNEALCVAPSHCVKSLSLKDVLSP